MSLNYWMTFREIYLIKPLCIANKILIKPIPMMNSGKFLMIRVVLFWHTGMVLQRQNQLLKRKQRQPSVAFLSIIRKKRDFASVRVNLLPSGYYLQEPIDDPA